MKKKPARRPAPSSGDGGEGESGKPKGRSALSKVIPNGTRDMRQLRVVVNGFESNVVEVIKAKRGFIYKIDNILPFRWNPGPTIVDFFHEVPEYVKLDFFVHKLPRDLRDQARYRQYLHRHI